MDSRDRSEAGEQPVEETVQESGFSVTVTGHGDPQIKVIGKPTGQMLAALARSTVLRFDAMKEAEESKVLLTILQRQVNLEKQQDRIEAMVGLLGKVVGTTDNHCCSTNDTGGDGS